MYYDYHLWYFIRPNYWGCTKCRTYISTRGNELKNKDLPLPTHSAHTLTSPDEFKVKQHLEVIKDRVAKEIHTWPSRIYDEEIIHLQTKQGVSAEAIALYTKGYSHHKSCFDAIRAKNKPKNPFDLVDFNFLLGEYVKFGQTISFKPFLQYDNRNNDGNRILIFASEVGLKILGQSKKWQSDGTFHCAPKPFKQVYYTMGGKPLEKMVPVDYVLMQKRTCDAYDEVFGQLKRIAHSYSIELAPLVCLTDFERAARKAIKFHFPSVHLRGCYFHFKQAVGRWIFRNGYTVNYVSNVIFKKWVNKITSLAVVPLDQVHSAWDKIKTESILGVNTTPIDKYF